MDISETNISNGNESIKSYNNDWKEKVKTLIRDLSDPERKVREIWKNKDTLSKDLRYMGFRYNRNSYVIDFVHKTNIELDIIMTPIYYDSDHDCLFCDAFCISGTLFESTPETIVDIIKETDKSLAKYQSPEYLPDIQKFVRENCNPDIQEFAEGLSYIRKRLSEYSNPDIQKLAEDPYYDFYNDEVYSYYDHIMYPYDAAWDYLSIRYMLENDIYINDANHVALQCIMGRELIKIDDEYYK